MNVNGTNDLFKGYANDDFLSEEVSLIADALTLIQLVYEHKYIGETHTVASGQRCLCAYNGEEEVCKDCSKRKDSRRNKKRTSLSAAVLRNMRKMLNEMYIEDEDFVEE